MKNTKKQNRNQNKNVIRKMVLITIPFFALLILAVSGSAALLHGFPYSEDLGITLLNQDPDPVEPGKYVDIRFMLENYGQNDAENVTFILIPKYPFSLDSIEEAEKNLGRINGGQMGRDSIIIKYRLRVDKNAIDGENPISIKYQTANNKGFIQIDDINITVKTRNVRLLIEDTQVEPERISPGETAEIKIKIKNIFSSQISNIRLRLLVNSTSFSTLGSDEAIIASMGPNDEEEVSFRIISNGDTDSKAYQLSLLTDFSDSLNFNYTKTNTITVIVDEKPSYMLNLDDTKVYLSGQKGKVTVSVSNTGQADMKYAVMELMRSDDYEILSSPKSYLGILESDDFQTAEFTIYVRAKDKATVPLLVRISYKDSYNKFAEEEAVLYLRVYSKSEASKYGLVQGNGKIGWVIAVIILAAAGFFVYKKFRRKSARLRKELAK